MDVLKLAPLPKTDENRQFYFMEFVISSPCSNFTVNDD